LLQTLFAYSAIAGLGIERIAVPVAGDLDAAILDVRQPVHLVFMMQPNRHRRRPELMRTSRWPEVEHLLPGGKNPSTQQLGEDPRQPCTACKNKGVTAYIFPSASPKIVDMIASTLRWHDFIDNIFDT